MVYIGKVYTRFGDGGQTMLASGTAVGKDTLRVCAYGDVDELNANIGMLRSELAREPQRDLERDSVTVIDEQLAAIQQELFNLGAELATPGSLDAVQSMLVDARHIDRLERDIDGHNASLAPLRSFVLPGGAACASAAHVSRTVCRRAERSVISLSRTEGIRPETIKYMNRLSDYLFVVARVLASAFGPGDVLWEPDRSGKP